MADLQEILLAEPRGFCAGVDRAIDIVEHALTKFGSPICATAPAYLPSLLGAGNSTTSPNKYAASASPKVANNCLGTHCNISGLRCPKASPAAI